MLWGDKALDDLLGIARTFVSQLPNFKCNDLFPQPLYYADITIWDTFFNLPADSLVYGMLDFDLMTRSEAHYYCIDTARAPAIMHMLIKAGIPIPKEILDAYSMINKIQNSLNFLNIQLRFEGMMITTDYYDQYRILIPNTWLDR
jgi:hypothetical protein